jgi:hypothetical protein
MHQTISDEIEEIISSRHQWRAEDYVKERLYVIKPADPSDPDQFWAFQRYWFYSRSLGDLAFNTFSVIVKTKDRSPWAHRAFEYCVELLREGKRWPDHLQEEYSQYIAKNSIQEALVKLKYRKEHKIHALTGKAPEHPILYRPQHQMTRDPHIAALACAVFLGRKHEIRDLKIPIKNYDPKVFAWRRKVFGKCNCYNFLNWLSKKNNKPQFVNNLQTLMDDTIELLK